MKSDHPPKKGYEMDEKDKDNPRNQDGETGETKKMGACKISE